MADIQDARRLVRALDVFADLHELPALIAHDGRVGQPLEMQRAGLDFLEKFVGTFVPHFAGAVGLNEEMQAVQLLPHFNRDLITHHPRVLAGRGDGGDNRVRVVRAENQELRHRLPVGLGIQLEEGFIIARGLDDRHPIVSEALVVEAAEIEEQLEIHIDDARDVFRPLDVAAHPEE